MKRFILTVLALALAFSGCAQNKGKQKQEALQASRLDSLESNFTRFQDQQLARDADIDNKLRDIASRLDRMNTGQQPVPSARKGKEKKAAQPSATRPTVAFGQVVPYSAVAGSTPASQPASAQPQPLTPSAPAPASPKAAQPVASQAAMPALQPPVVSLGDAGRPGQPVAPSPVQSRQPVPLDASRHGKDKASARTPQPVAPAAQPAPVAPAPQAAPAKSASAPAPAADVQEQMLYTEALRAVSANRNEEGRKKFNEFLAKYPNSSKTPEALYWIGESYMGDKSYNQAILSFKEVTSRYPKDSKSPESLYKIADAYERLGDKANAVFHLKMLVEENPNSDLAGKAKLKLKQLGQ